MPTACLLIGSDFDGQSEQYFGLLKSITPITTLESHLKFSSAQLISPSSRRELLSLVSTKSLSTNFRTRLQSKEPVVCLSPMLSVHLVEKLAGIDSNRAPMRAVISSLDAPEKYSGNAALQVDAVRLALKVFGISPSESAARVDIAEGKETALASIKILEDAVIEHDARSVAGFTLESSDVTGRAVFRNGHEKLEIITANRRPLEKVFGVDMIYFNATKQNVVMV